MSQFITKPKNELARENDNGTSSTASLIDDDENDLSRHSKRTVVEPVLFVLLTAVTLSETAIPNVVELHYCRSILNVSDDICFNNTSKYETSIQTFTSTYGMIKTFTEVLLPCIASFCVGPWSDVFGRKPVILFASLGYFTSYCLWTWLTTISHLHPLGFILASIPIGLSGGTPLFLMGMFCYVCDITKIEHRALRLGVLQCLFSASNLVGTLMCPYIAAFNYTSIFAFSAVLCYACMTYVYFWTDESITSSQEVKDQHSKNPLNLQYAYGLFDTCLTKLNSTTRLTVLFLTTCLTFSLTALLGEMSLLYLFMQDILGWNLNQFSVLNTFQVIASVVGAFGALWIFSHKLKVNDLYLLIWAVFLRLMGSLTMVFGFKVWHIYLSRALCSFSGIIDPLIRSFLSKIVPHEEIGKIFSILAAGGSVTPLLASSFYSMVYNVTVDGFPSGIFLLSGILLLVDLYVLLLTFLLHAPPERRTPLPVNINN